MAYNDARREYMRLWRAKNAAHHRAYMRDYMRDWNDRNPDKRAANHLRSKGFTVQQYAEMLAEQGGVCAICGGAETLTLKGKLRSLCIDHDHRCCPGQRTCGECTRGLLCASCNVAIGKMNDDPALLRRAADYLEL